MKKIIFYSTLFVGTFLHGMVLNEERRQIKVPEDTYIGFNKQDNSLPIFIPSYCLPAQCKALKNKLPDLDLSSRMGNLLVESLASLQLFPKKKEYLLQSFEKKVRSIFSNTSYAHSLKFIKVCIHFLKSLSLLGFPEEYISSASTIFTALKKASNSTNSNNLKKDTIKIVIFESIDGFHFPINKGFLPKSFQKKYATQPASIKREVSRSFDSEVMGAVIPLIINYSILKKYKVPPKRISLKCASKIAKALLQFTTSNIMRAKKFKRALHFFDLKELVALVEKIKPKFLMLRKFTLEKANAFVQELESAGISRSIIGVISQVVAQKYGLSQIKDLNLALAIENAQSIISGDDIVANLIVPIDFEHTAQKWVGGAEWLKSYLMTQLNPTDEYKRRIALNFLQVSKPYRFQEEVLDENSWKDLELFCGQKKNTSNYVASHLPAITEMGKVFVYRKVANCTANINTLRASQRVIRTFYESPDYEALERAFETLREAEPGVFSFWDRDDKFEYELDNHLYKSEQFELWNSDPFCLEIRERYEQLNLLAGLPISILQNMLFIGPTIGRANVDRPTATARSLGILGTLKEFNELISKYPEYVKLAAYFRICLRVKLMYLAHYFKAVDKIVEVLKVMNNDETINGFIDKLNYKNQSDKILALRTMLDTDTFKGNSLQDGDNVLKIFTFYNGRVICAYNLMRKYKNQLATVIATLGELDTIITACRLLRQSEDKQARYCIPTFIEKIDAPHIIIKDSWNPIIDSDNVVVNSLNIGSNRFNPKNIIINGPNAGGKSSIMKGVIIAIIFAQSLGVAPAKELTFTPFHKIRAYLNITDNQAEGNSLFMAAVKRAFDLYSTVSSLPKGKFSLTAFDEVFNGTSTSEGEAAAFSLLENLGYQQRNISLVTTHFKSLMTLEKEYPGKFVNYKVSAEKKDGKLHYPFKLEKGTSNLNIAFQVLREEGFDEEFVRKCEEKLKLLANDHVK